MILNFIINSHKNIHMIIILLDLFITSKLRKNKKKITINFKNKHLKKNKA